MERSIVDDSRIHIVFLQTSLPPLSFCDDRTIRNIPLGAGVISSFALDSGLEGVVRFTICNNWYATWSADAALLNHLESIRPDILCITNYLWNIERQLYIARILKKRLPYLIVIAGGPEVSRDIKQFRNYTSINVAICGEGEIAFVNVIKHIVKTGHVEGIEDPDLMVDTTSAPGVILVRSRIWCNITRSSSPYLRGLINPQGLDYIPLEAERGCPYKCDFCSYPKRPRVLANTTDRITEEIRWAIWKGIRQVYFVDGTFNSTGTVEAKCAALRSGGAPGALDISIECRAELITKEIAKELALSGVRNVEVGLQTLGSDALRNVRRKNIYQAFVQGCHWLIKAGIRLKIGIIVGLPGDRLKDIADTIEFLKENSIKGRIVAFLLSVLPGTAVRKNAGLLGLRYMHQPPYYILSSPTWSREDLRRAFYLLGQKFPRNRERERLRKKGFFNFTSNNEDSDGHGIQTVMLNLSEYPLKRDLTIWGKVLANSVMNMVVVWLEINDANILKGTKTLLREVARRNPYMRILIITKSMNLPSDSSIRIIKGLTTNRAHLDEHFQGLIEGCDPQAESLVAFVTEEIDCSYFKEHKGVPFYLLVKPDVIDSVLRDPRLDLFMGIVMMDNMSKQTEMESFVGNKIKDQHPFLEFYLISECRNKKCCIFDIDVSNPQRIGRVIIRD